MVRSVNVEKSKSKTDLSRIDSKFEIKPMTSEAEDNNLLSDLARKHLRRPKTGTTRHNMPSAVLQV